MFSTRIISFFFVLATLGMLAWAKPIDVSSDLVARAPTSLAQASSLVARCDTCTCTTAGCNEAAIKQILVNLEASINVYVGFFDGITTPGPYVTLICTEIEQAVSLLAAVDVNVSTAGSLVVDIVNIIVAIILALAKCVSAYGLAVSITFTGQFDAALKDLVSICIELIPGLSADLSSALNVDIVILQKVQFVLTLIACNLPCGC